MNIYFVNRYSKLKGPFDIIDSNRQHIIKVGDICLRDTIEGVAFYVVYNSTNMWNACKLVGIGRNETLSEIGNTLLFSFDGLSRRKGDIKLIEQLTLCYREKVIDDFFRNAVDILEYKKDLWDGSLFPQFFASSQELVNRDEKIKSDISTETNYYPTVFAQYLSKELLELLTTSLNEGNELKEAYLVLREKHPEMFRKALMKFLTENPSSSIYDEPADTFVPVVTEVETPMTTFQNGRQFRITHNIVDEPLKPNERTKKYLSKISCQELLSDEEEIELAQKVRRGEIDARNKLVSANMRFVVGLAKQYLHKGLEFEDLLHEGFRGLIRAAERFDETRGFRFIYYASWWIKRYLTNAVVNNASLIRFPLNVQTLHRRIWDYKVKYEHKNGFLPPITEIEVDDEDNLERISFLDSLPNNLKNTCVPCEDLDVFEDNHNDIRDYDENEYKKQHVRSLLDHLSKRERDILIRTFGIGVKEETLEIIGESYGLTRERVRQIKEKAVRKLRELLTLHKTADDEEEDSPEQEVAKPVVESKPKPKKQKENPEEKVVPSFLHNSFVRKEEPIKEEHPEDEADAATEVSEKDGLKVGDNINYNNQFCTVRKIIENGKSSKLVVEYSNGVQDFVVFDKSRFYKVTPAKESYPKEYNHEMREQSHSYSSSTSLNELVGLRIITWKQLKHCHKRNLRTIGDVQNIIEQYHLTPDSTRFTQYTLDIWFSIVGLLKPKEEVHDDIEHVYVDIPSADPYIETEVSIKGARTKGNKPIDTKKLEAIFDNKSTSYKYFWFMAIISLAKENQTLSISYKDILIRMAALAWPIVLRHKIGLGKQDMFFRYLSDIVNRTSLDSRSTGRYVEFYLVDHYEDAGINRTLAPLLNNVPYRFLSPWVKFTTNKDVSDKSKSVSFDGLYALYSDGIVLNSKWWHYINAHYREICNSSISSFNKFAEQNNSRELTKRIKYIDWNLLQQ